MGKPGQTSSQGGGKGRNSKPVRAAKSRAAKSRAGPSRTASSRRATSRRGTSPAKPPGRNGSLDYELVFTISSDFTAGHDVQKQILDAVEKAGFNSQSTFAIKLALEEALINAIKHGNKLDTKKLVHIRASVSPQRTEIIIEDQGPGFDRASVPDPTLEENLDKCSGRGILLMEAYMNRVQWSRGGRRVHMVKKNEADLPSK